MVCLQVEAEAQQAEAELANTEDGPAVCTENKQHIVTGALHMLEQLRQFGNGRMLRQPTLYLQRIVPFIVCIPALLPHVTSSFATHPSQVSGCLPLSFARADS